MSSSVLDKIRSLLSSPKLSYKEIEHAPTFTSEESARARGEELEVGAKAILMKIADDYRLFVLPANRRLDSSAIKRELGAKSMRFASREELLELTGLVPGSVPPFGPPVLPFKLYCDLAVGASRDRVAFNAGSLTVSMVMAASDWEKAAQPSRFSFSKSSEEGSHG
jgi:prolyl-tRNA editing enzyme YbaK/EbsC (Cys-tRNA(Pro) deacylase)